MAIHITNRSEDLNDANRTDNRILWAVLAVIAVAIIAYAVYAAYYSSPTSNYNTESSQPLLNGTTDNTSGAASNDNASGNNTSPNTMGDQNYSPTVPAPTTSPAQGSEPVSQ